MNANDDQPAPTWRKIKRWAGYTLGAALLIACIVMALRGGDWQRLAEVEPSTFGWLILLVVLSLFFSTNVFSLLTIPYAPEEKPVPWIVMLALISASTLLNYLPLRPGLIGRAAFLKKYYDIAYRSSVRILLIAITISATIYGSIFALGLRHHCPDFLITLLLAGAFILALLGAGMHVLHLLVRKRFRAATHMWYLTGVAIHRFSEVAIATIRLMIVFHLLDVDIYFSHAAILATCGMFITLVGITPNGLGLREWLYGLIAASGFFGGDVEGGLRLGLQVALIDRAAESLVVIPSGLAGMVYLKNKPRRSQRS